MPDMTTPAEDTLAHEVALEAERTKARVKANDENRRTAYRVEDALGLALRLRQDVKRLSVGVATVPEYEVQYAAIDVSPAYHEKITRLETLAQEIVDTLEFTRGTFVRQAEDAKEAEFWEFGPIPQDDGQGYTAPGDVDATEG